MKSPSVLLAITTFTAFAALASTATLAADIDDAWQQLLSEHNGLQAQNQLVMAKQAQVDVAKGMRLPSLTLSSQWNLMNDELGLWLDTSILMPGGKPVYLPIQEQSFWDTQLTATMPVFTGGKISAGIQAKQADVTLQRAQQTQVENELFSQFVRRYLSINLAIENESIRRLAFDNLEQHLQRAIRMQAEGSIAYTERLQAEVERDKAQREWRNAVAQRDLAVSAYQSLFDDAPTLPANTLHFQPFTTLNNNVLALRAIQNHPGIQQLSAQQAKASAGLKSAQASFLPTVALFANVELATNELTQLEPEWTAGINMQWRLFGQGNRWRESAGYRAAISATQFSQVQAERDIRVLIEQLQVNINMAEENVNAFSSSIQLAEENRRLRESAFEQGISTSLDKIDAQLLLTGLQLERQKSLFDYYVALADLCVLTAQQNKFFALFYSL